MTLPSPLSAQHDPPAGDAPFYHAWHAAVPKTLSKRYRVTLAALFLLVGAGTVLAMSAPIQGSFLSQGRVIAQGKNRIIEHLEGGIVTEVLVREGEAVSEGQILAYVDVANAETKLRTAQRARATARIRLARYLAEQSDAETIDFPDDLGRGDAVDRDEVDAAVREAIETQTREFLAKREEQNALRSLLEERISSNRALIADLSDLSNDQERRIKDTEEEVAVSDAMLEQGLTTRDRNFNLKRQLDADRDRLRNTRVQIAERESQIEQTREQLTRAEAQRRNEINESILDLRAQIFEQNEAISYYGEVAGRSRVVSPVAGIIIDVAVNTRDAVVRPGEALFEVFPDGLPIAVEAQVGPELIDSVHIGQAASMSFPSRERSRAIRRLRGEVAFVSRDSEQDERTGLYTYTVRVRLDPDSLAEYGEVVPGNLAEIYFALEEQNFFRFLINPLMDAGEKAFVG